MIKINTKGNWNKTDNFFKKSVRITKIEDLTLLGETIVERLIAATPKDSGVTAKSWGFTVLKEQSERKLYITNSNIQNGTKIALLIEFGHTTISGTWVEGANFIGPITRDAYNEVLSKLWKEMKRL